MQLSAKVSMESTPKLDFVSRLKSYREQRGMTQEDLALALGISRNYVHLLEAGKKSAGRFLVDRFVALESGGPAALKEESPPYRVNFRLDALSDAELQTLFDTKTAEVKAASPDRKRILLESIRALAQEIESRIGL